MAKANNALAAAPAKLAPTFLKPTQPAAIKAIVPGDHVANGHNVVIDWRDPGVLAVEIDTTADVGLANVLQTKKKDEAKGHNYTLAKTAGTMYGATVIQTADGAQWYLTVKAEKILPKAGK